MEWQSKILGALLLLLISSNRVTASEDLQVPVQFSLPEFTASPGDTLEMPISIGDITDLGILSANIVITYDARVLTAHDVILSGTLTEGWFEAHRIDFVDGSQDTSGLVSIALSTSSQSPTGAGVFVTIRLSVLSDAGNQQNSPILFSTAILNNRNPQTTVIQGSITVVAELIGDFDANSQVDFSDFLLFVRKFRLSQIDPEFDSLYDLDNDGAVDFNDFLIFAAQFSAS